MKRWMVLSVVLLVAAVAYGQKEAYPGQSHHGEPPKDWACTTRKDAPKAHQCSCHRECAENETGQIVEQEDPKCTVWCWQKHCTCPSKCSST